MMKMKNIKEIAMVVVMMIAGIGSAAGQTADAVLKKVSAAITNAGGLSSGFSMTSGSSALKGTLKSDGDRFSIETPTSSVWFDGKTMWTHNARTNETTVTTPTSTELAEANPLHLVKAYTGSFTAAFAKGQTKGSKTIVLTPKSKKLGYKSVHVTIPDGSSFPSQLVVIPSSGQKIVVRISSVKTRQKFPSGTFAYPSARYKGVEIVDLR